MKGVVPADSAEEAARRVCWQPALLAQSKRAGPLGDSRLDVMLGNTNTEGPGWNALAMHSKHLIPGPGLQG